MVNPEIANEISKLKYLHVSHTLSYEAILRSHNEAMLEHEVKKQIVSQLADHIWKDLDLNVRDTHHGRSYELETYFFTRTELLRLAENLYLRGIHRKEDLHQNFTSPQG